MECTHPVLYSHNGELYCHISGAVLPPAELTPPQEPQEVQKPAPKRGKKTKAD